MSKIVCNELECGWHICNPRIFKADKYNCGLQKSANNCEKWAELNKINEGEKK